MRRRMEAGGHTAVRVDAARRVAAHLEREDAGRVRGERQRLQVEHQLHVVVERIRHADRRLRHLARLAALVVGLDLLDAAFDLAHFIQVVRQAAPVGGAELPVQAAELAADEVEDALVFGAPRGALLRRRADTEQLVERHARIAHHRQRLIVAGPADGVGVDARVAIRTAARLIDRFDAQLHRGNRRVLAELLRVHLVERDRRRARRSLASATDGSGSGTPRSSGSDRRRFRAVRTLRHCARRCC